MNANGPLFDKRKRARAHTATAIGNLFRSGRLARGIHQEAFAKVLGLTRRQLSAIELGDKTPEPGLLFKFSKETGILLVLAVEALNASRPEMPRLIVSGESIREASGPLEMQPGVARLKSGALVRPDANGAPCGEYLEPPSAAAGSLDWLNRRAAAAESTAPLGKTEHDAVNAKLEENYARRVNLGSSYADFVAWIETRSPFPENRDHQEAWSQAVLELYAHRPT